MTDTPPPPRKPREDELDYFGISHTGLVRAENQDHFLMASFHKRVHVQSSNVPDIHARMPSEEQRLAHLAMVADGVGGGQGGAEASAIALEAAMRYVDNAITTYYGARHDGNEFGELLQAAALRAHESVVARRLEQGIRGTMATTLTLYIGVWPVYYVLQVGDSRYYRWRDGALLQLTRDQTVAQDLVDDGVMSRADAARTPFANVLSSAIGSDSTAPVVTRLDFAWNNVHLLCSDGLTKHVSEARMAEVLGSMTSAKQACEQLLQDALENGGSDNVTIIIGRSVSNTPD